ncbi:hypothetical protein Tco_0537524 [Tanacetum coccineum]
MAGTWSGVRHCFMAPMYSIAILQNPLSALPLTILKDEWVLADDSTTFTIALPSRWNLSRKELSEFFGIVDL